MSNLSRRSVDASWAGGPVRRWLAPLVVLAVAFSGVLWSQGDQVAREPDARDRAVLMTIGRVLPERHLSRHPLDDAISTRALDDLLRELDPSKLYFLKSDVADLARFRDVLDDMMRTGDDKPVKTVSALFLKRLEERVGWAREFLASDLHFEQEEFWATDPKRLEFAETVNEARDRWRRRIKYEVLLMEGPDLSRAQVIEKLRGRYDRYLARMNGLDDLDWLAFFVNAVTTAYDPHTTWMTPRELEDFEISMRLNFEGIGAQLHDEDGYTTIAALMSGGAAIKDGKLQAGDRILAVAQGETGAWKDVVGLPISDVVKLIRGPAGTVVRLQVRPKSGTEVRTHVLVRQTQQIEESAARGEVFEVKDSGGGRVAIGVINLPEFYRDDEAAAAGSKTYRSAARDVARILAEFRGKGVAGVVLDLRLNGGGSLKEAVEVTGLFIDAGPVVRVRDSRGAVRDLDDEDRGMAWTGPLVVLTSRLSASASEILAGAIQDYRRGVVVGDPKTFGKGTVQTVLPLDRRADRHDMGALKLTIQQFYRPGGLSTQRRGVTPDVVLPSVTSELEAGEEDLSQALPADQVAPARFTPDAEVDAALVRQLDEASRKRRPTEEYFKKLESGQAWARKQKAAARVPLEEKAFRAFRAEETRMKSLEPDSSRTEANRIVRDGYLDEVLAITADLGRVRQA